MLLTLLVRIIHYSGLVLEECNNFSSYRRAVAATPGGPATQHKAAPILGNIPDLMRAAIVRCGVLLHQGWAGFARVL